MNTNKKLRIGTRTSSLAMTQSEWVATKIRALYPDLAVELVGIKVAADEGLDTPLSQKPLWQLDEKNVFTRELDDALLRGDIDCTIHSFKDLSTDRPDNIELAAIPGRENPHDIVLFHPRILEKLKAGQAITIGTSAPRRMTNVAPFLERALPRLSDHKVTIETKPIRGNVDSRIRRLFEPEASERYVDAVVLALAGVSRLYNNHLLRDTLPQLHKMLLPLTYCPAAPAQGALAIECRSDDDTTHQILSSLHDREVAVHIEKERAQLVLHGGGCHQAFGATSVPHPRFQNGLMYVHGKKSDGQNLDDTIWDKPPAPENVLHIWDGMDHRAQTASLSPGTPTKAGGEGERLGEGVVRNAQAIFISHARASNAALDQLQNKPIWTSGAESWLAMAEKGLWVQGCGDGLGIEFLRTLFATPCLELPEWKDWIVLTNDEAKDGWKESNVIGTYKIDSDLPEDALAQLQKATHIFWGSSFQFDRYKDYALPDAHHACGAGKTADHLEKQNLKNFDIFPNRREWQKWIAQ